MPTTAFVDWGDTWLATSIAASAIANAGSATTGEISNDGKSGTEIAIEIAYGSTATEGVKVYILRECNGSYEAAADNPYGFEMPKTVSTTHRRVITLDGLTFRKFKILITNNSGASVTATVTYNQGVIGQATS